MTGNGLLTGSSTNGVNVTAVPTNTALHLYGVAPNGTLTSMTIFGAARNVAGRYNAVMSYHGCEFSFIVGVERKWGCRPSVHRCANPDDPRKRGFATR